ncbi:MAG: NAD(P)/FAD-dependent oxidoreductase [Deltaproteobacteria bacterium]|jgi:prolycopene isomerase|nr:NAD(P)/FAD-dependent oxidoreductase [Deltaproteobacteria bacterium]
MANYDAIVIGAGNGGLTAAATLAKEGLDVLLLERHNIPGGAATSFCRGRFEFEVALHQLSGLGTPDKPGLLRTALDRLGVLDDLEFVEISDLYHIATPDGFRLTIRPDRIEAAAAFQEKFPHEKDAIQGYFDLLENFANDFIGAFIFRDPEASREKYPRLYENAFKPSSEILDSFFSDPLLKAALSVYWGYLGVPPTRLAFAYLAMIFFQYVEFKPFHVKGGSQALSNAILNKFLSYGGTARFNCGANKILVEDGAVTGVLTATDEKINCAHVISNASQVSTYTELIDPQHVPDSVTIEMKGRRLSTSAFSMFVGFDCSPDELGITVSTNFLMAAPDISDAILERMRRIDIEDELMVMSCYDIADPDFSPPGTCQVNIVTLKYADPWLQIPPAKYHETKYRCAEGMLKRMEEIFPGARSHIEEIEVATPLTHMRYLGTPGGAIYGYEQLPKDSLFFQPGRYAPINGLLFAGGWIGDCGFEPTLRSGISAAKSIIKRLGQGRKKS